MRRYLTAFALAAVSSFAASDARAQTYVMSGTRSIQEDWVLVVAKGDPTNDGPQAQTYMSHVADTSQPYAWFMLNARDNPFSGGGMQVQVWTYADVLLTSATSGSAKLSTANETIKWTQRLAVVPASTTYQLSYSIINGSSTTWGAFGTGYGLGAVTYLNGQAAYNSLYTYDPTVSVAKSRVGFQANNVVSFGIAQIRQYDGDGSLIKTDTTSRPVSLAVQ